MIEQVDDSWLDTKPEKHGSQILLDAEIDSVVNFESVFLMHVLAEEKLEMVGRGLRMGGAEPVVLGEGKDNDFSAVFRV